MSTESTHSIVIANDLQTGRSVFLTSKSGWSEVPKLAELIESESVAEARLQAALKDEGNNIVIDPYLVSVGADGQVRDIRERIRTKGPTIRIKSTDPAFAIVDPSVVDTGTRHGARGKTAPAEAA